MTKTDFKMADYNQNKNPINVTVVFWTKVSNEKDISAKQIIPCLGTLSTKSENVIANIVKKRIIL